jgi:hypothetical protein
MYPRDASLSFLRERVDRFLFGDPRMSAFIVAIIAILFCCVSSCSFGVLLNYASKNRNPPPVASTAAPPPPATEATSAPTKAPQIIKSAKPGDTVAKGGASAKKTTAPTSAPAAPAGGGKVIAEKARTSYYRPNDNDPPGSRNCAYKNPCTSQEQGSPSSAAHAADGSSPYKKGALYTISGAGKPPFCVRIDDTCAACKGTWIDIFLENGQKLPFDYAKISEGC